jgi:WD40 repeat protein
MSEDRIERELRAALDEVYQPAPWLLSKTMAAVRSVRPARQSRPWVAGLAAVVLAVGSIAGYELVQKGQTTNGRIAPITSLLPKPIPQPITRTSLAAQVAWVSVPSQGQRSYATAVDPSGKLVARLDQSPDTYGVWRSADGSAIFSVAVDTISSYSAVDGKFQRTFARQPGGVVGEAFSPDGRWLAILTLATGLHLEVIDLQSGSSQVLPVAHDPTAHLPGMSCNPNPSCGGTIAWGLVVFAPDSAHIYTLTDWAGPTRLTAFSLKNATLVQTLTEVDGHGRKFPACAGPAMVAKVVAGGHTLVTFCHFDGAVWFFNLSNLSLSSSGIVRPKQPSPFWLSPIFTPDGQLLYLHQWPGFGDTMQVVDLTNQRLLGPVPTPTDTEQKGPFAWLIPDVHAGGVASTVPVSPDGLELYSATEGGVLVMRVPDLKLTARLAPGFNSGEIWVSGDGQTIYALSEGGQSLLVMRSDGSHQKLVNLASAAVGFIATEHG